MRQEVVWWEKLVSGNAKSVRKCTSPIRQGQTRAYSPHSSISILRLVAIQLDSGLGLGCCKRIPRTKVTQDLPPQSFLEVRGLNTRRSIQSPSHCRKTEPLFSFYSHVCPKDYYCRSRGRWYCHGAYIEVETWV